MLYVCQSKILVTENVLYMIIVGNIPANRTAIREQGALPEFLIWQLQYNHYIANEILV
jgi:hypothetical protein